MKRLTLYVYYFFKADTKSSRTAGMKAARNWCKARHAHHWTDAYRRDFQAFSRAYQMNYCHAIAKAQVNKKLGLQ